MHCFKAPHDMFDNADRYDDFLEDKEGLLEDTVISYKGDQDMFPGEHDFIDKRWIYEEAVRMPLIVGDPKAVKPGSRNAWLVKNTDFASTMLEPAGVATPSYTQGRSWRLASNRGDYCPWKGMGFTSSASNSAAKGSSYFSPNSASNLRCSKSTER